MTKLLHSTTCTVMGRWDAERAIHPRIKVAVEIRATDNAIDLLTERAQANAGRETVVGDSGSRGNLIAVDARGTCRINPHAINYQAERAYQNRSGRRQLAAGLITVVVTPVAG